MTSAATTPAVACAALAHVVPGHGLGDLTEADFAIIRALGIRTVIDLRSAEELERGRFDVGAHPVTFHHFPIIEKLPDADAFDRQPGLLGTQYLDMIRDAGASFVSVLEILAAPGSLPAVFHCTAGKDRTACCPRSSCRSSVSTSPPSSPTTRSAASP